MQPEEEKQLAETGKKTGGFMEGASQATKAVGESLSNLAGAITGKTLEDRIVEYSEIFGDVLLRLHETVEQLKQDRATLSAAERETLRKLEKISGPEYITAIQDAARLRNSMMVNRWISIGAVLLSAVAIVLYFFG